MPNRVLEQVVRQATPVASSSRWWHTLLRVGLLSKLLGATLAVAFTALIVLAVVHGGDTANDHVLQIASGAILAAVLVNAGLVVVALQPLRALEQTVARIASGETAARVPREFLLADPELARLGGTLNALLDALVASQVELRRLAHDAIAEGDKERADVAYQLHESSAQTLVGIQMELSALQRDLAGDPPMAARAGRLRDTTGEVLEQVRRLSETLHPPVLETRGLAAALVHLARRAGERHGVEVQVETADAPPRVPPTVARILYQVAREVVATALLHSAPRRITLVLKGLGPRVVLEVAEDGRAAQEEATQGLLRMRERLALVDGTFDVRREPSGGTRAVAAVALTEDRDT